MIFQKCTSLLRILAYDSPADSVDMYIQITKSTVVECLQKIVSNMCAIFGDEYPRRPNNKDTWRLQIEAVHGFLGMLGFIDCMQWE